ncbi:hypothetical protein [Paenibacillus taichungensis]|uniref:hypothetical protein n=1 Tax=Paenibacillus taichungensis TaxID=484184 RepID=UPI0011B6F426|nr:hypothetical protein [Paenibacillus taichungensis]
MDIPHQENSAPFASKKERCSFQFNRIVTFHHPAMITIERALAAFSFQIEKTSENTVSQAIAHV